jgi:hypothetical protein
MSYRREIDVLRALAVLPVIPFHADLKTFSGGFVGVDVFFVISGYLISTIIIAELDHGKFSIINFYERRARRIFPALFVVMFVCIPLARIALLPSDVKDFSQSLAAVFIFASNILFWRESGYFDTAAELKPHSHRNLRILGNRQSLLNPQLTQKAETTQTDTFRKVTSHFCREIFASPTRIPFTVRRSLRRPTTVRLNFL